MDNYKAMEDLPLATRNLVNDQYISVSVPDTPRAVTAGGDTMLALPNLPDAVSLPADRRVERILRSEREACHIVLANQRDDFEHAAWMFQAQAENDRVRAEQRTSMIVSGEYEDAMFDSQIQARHEIQVARQEVIHKAQPFYVMNKQNFKCSQDVFMKKRRCSRISMLVQLNMIFNYFNMN